MTTNLPPLGGDAPGLRCSRLLRWPDQTTQCPNDAAVHVMWTSDGDNGLCCTEHAAELAYWRHVDSHPYDPTCSIGGALWVWGDPSRCVVDELPGLADVAMKADATWPY